LNENLIQQKEGEKKRQARIKALEKNIAQMQHELDNPPKTESMDVINEDFVGLFSLSPL